MQKRTRDLIKLRLYIVGDAPNSLAAIANLKAMCAQRSDTGYEIEIIDLLTHPARALADRIIVTPTLIKLRPLPVRRVIGSLSDAQQMLTVLAGE